MLRGSLICVFFFLLIIQTPSLTNATAHAVRDIDGDEIECSEEYYMISAIWGAGGGGLSLACRNSTSLASSLASSCSNIMQHQRETKWGQTLKFIPLSSSSAGEGIIWQTISRAMAAGERIIEETQEMESIIAETPERERTIRESINLNIKFSNMSTIWQVRDADKSERGYITADGRAGDSAAKNLFKIEKSGPYGYKIVHCSSKTMCRDVGISSHSESETRWLSMSDQPLWVIFKKAERN
ncbi:21 kDa seed protein-like [Tasmannia lanceolata]|uniref:21 kDa seed protein-like n=1 Tax=Tasmannia lanceolata TaxID=3420 RepID=UPI004064A75B